MGNQAERDADERERAYQAGEPGRAESERAYQARYQADQAITGSLASSRRSREQLDRSQKWLDQHPRPDVKAKLERAAVAIDAAIEALQAISDQLVRAVDQDRQEQEQYAEVNQTPQERDQARERERAKVALEQSRDPARNDPARYSYDPARDPARDPGRPLETQEQEQQRLARERANQ